MRNSNFSWGKMQQKPFVHMKRILWESPVTASQFVKRNFCRLELQQWLLQALHQPLLRNKKLAKISENILKTKQKI